MRSTLLAGVILVVLLFTALDALYLGGDNLFNTDLIKSFNRAADSYSADGGLFQNLIAGFTRVVGVLFVSATFIGSTLWKMASFNYAFLADALGGYGTIVRAVCSVTMWGVLINAFATRFSGT